LLAETVSTCRDGDGILSDEEAQLGKEENDREKLARSKLSADDPNYIESSSSSEPRSLGDSSKAQEGGVAALNDDELNEIEEVYQAIEDVSQSLLGAMDDRGL
jgi:hypothetical protein